MRPGTANEGWQQLQLPSRRQCPKLFYAFTAQKDSFTLLLTDLISLWSVSLDRDDIITEAARQHASIDPSASTDQFGVLLSRIRESLKEGKNALVREDGRGTDILLLRTTVELPRPLRPLEWTFRLEPQNASELAEHILRPSLHEISISHDKIESLHQIIKDKDHVISRLLDRIGNSAVDLGLIFPGITGFTPHKYGHVSVADAKKYVPGMAAFEETSWSERFFKDEGYEGADRTGLANLVRGCEKCFAHTKSQHESWVKSLSSSGTLDNNGDNGTQLRAAARKASQQQQDPGDDSTDSNDDFERQPTPPLLKSKSPETRKTAQAEAEDNTEEEVPPSRRTKPSKIGSLARRKVIKAFGGSKSGPKSSSSAGQSSSPLRRQSDASTATSTATASDDRSDSDSQPPPKHQDTTTRSSQKFRLGTLRNKKFPTPSHATPSPSRSISPVARAREQSEQIQSRPQSRGTESEAHLGLDGPHTLSSPRHRLGRLAQKPATAKPSNEQSASVSPEPQDESYQRSPTVASASVSTPKRRLGRLGGRKRRETGSSTGPSPESSEKKSRTKARVDVEMKDTPADDEAIDSDATGSPSPSPSPSTSKRHAKFAHHPESNAGPRSAAAAEPEPAQQGEKAEEKEQKPKEETEDQKADRRRMELKRALASNAGGKKKRRF
ncbi:uncharacterized protein Z518_02859 [Rhinocladiella mackenziei CBS 650.93]|uniref:Non-homologous end-joining factor 1 n=1 Tax=Rhinocladiella mackenziei CBS 650.93 TaxID=1442369 RepID=A0A0D2HCL8_9EURO|nr:uncharacterized protein Z518_02859 [Rhinocladiella mackenziei CBS 650.93]KIX08203.1 hypothetical protein Z518_02859 [Rhinocladiella mackenziei CBS 650.93]